MDTNIKAIAVLALIIIVLFSGGLYYVYYENQRHVATLNAVQQYLQETSPAVRTALEQEIRTELNRRPFAMTSKAGNDTWEELLENGKSCDIWAKNKLAIQRDPELSYSKEWMYCMNNLDSLHLKKEAQ